MVNGSFRKRSKYYSGKTATSDAFLITQCGRRMLESLKNDKVNQAFSSTKTQMKISDGDKK